MNKRDNRRSKSTLDTARADPSALYGADYYAYYGSDPAVGYGRHEPWISFFAAAAREIKRCYKPRTSVDLGCALGLLVEALNDVGVDAYGYDVSAYAISNSRPDMVNRLKVHSIHDPIPLLAGRRYDLATCIEVLEHLPPEQTDLALDNLCAASNLVLFSSSPDDHEEPTHFNVRETAEWLSLFAARGFYPARRHQAAFIAPHAFVVQRTTRWSTIRRVLGFQAVARRRRF